MAVMMNDHTLYEHILDDEYFIGVVGMLECVSPPYNRIILGDS